MLFASAFATSISSDMLPVKSKANKISPFGITPGTITVFGIEADSPGDKVSHTVSGSTEACAGITIRQKTKERTKNEAIFLIVFSYESPPNAGLWLEVSFEI
jgi:hypothetical protein